MALTEETVRRTRELLDRFLAGRAEETRRAYATDLRDFARFRDREPAEAIADLLEGPLRGRRLVAAYVIEMRQQGRSPATVSRRLGTLRSLARSARDAGLVAWVLELPDEEGVAAAAPQPAEDSYVLPRHPSELDRLDIQHYAMREALEGNHLAPIGGATTILDVGCGTGQWAFDLCAEHAAAMVVGLDLVAGKPDPPPNYRFVRANLLQGMPFVDGRFDFVHQRFLVSGIPVVAWQGVIEELVRVTRPGGWIELVEGTAWVEPAGSATSRLFEMGFTLARARGLDMSGILFASLDERLRAAGLTDVRRRVLAVPIGEWGGRAGSLMASDMRAVFTRMADVFQARLDVPAAESQELINTMQLEWEEYRTHSNIAVAYGRRPSR